MNKMNTLHSEPQSILKAFEKLQADYQRESAQIATKQDLAIQKKNKELVEQASTYTTDTLFQSLTQLQSTFSKKVDELIKKMTDEVEKLAQIQCAIKVEKQQLTTLDNIQIVAEALNILQQEHQYALQNLEKDYQQRYETLELERVKQREIWQKQQQDYEKAHKKQQKLLEKDRHLEEEEYNYKLKRQQTEGSDEHEKRKRTLERQLADNRQIKEKNWGEREKSLEKHQTEFDEYKTKVESIPTEIAEAVKKAREQAIKETYKDEENKANLLEKEREAKRKAFELKIDSLKKTVEEQKIRIVQLAEQLQTASQQIQQLAMTAVGSAGQSKRVDKTR